jgi:hypothetical protein
MLPIVETRVEMILLILLILYRESTMQRMTNKQFNLMIKDPTHVISEMGIDQETFPTSRRAAQLSHSTMSMAGKDIDDLLYGSHRLPIIPSESFHMIMILNVSLRSL